MPDDNSYLPMIREIFEPFGVAGTIPRHQGVSWSGLSPDAEERAWAERASETRQRDAERRLAVIRQTHQHKARQALGNALTALRIAAVELEAIRARMDRGDTEFSFQRLKDARVDFALSSQDLEVFCGMMGEGE